MQKKSYFKVIACLFIIFFGFTSAAYRSQQLLNTNTFVGNLTLVISTESTESSITPAIAVDFNNNIYVVWIDATDYDGSSWDFDIFYKTWTVNTSSWSLTEVVSTESSGASLDPAIAVDHDNNVHVVWVDLTDLDSAGLDPDIFYKWLNTTSGAWSTTEIISTESDLNSVEPAIAVDLNNNIHVVWTDLTDYGGSGTDTDIFHKMFDANIALWTVTDVVSTESTLDAYYPTITVDHSNTLHVAWSDSTDYNGSGEDLDIFYKTWIGGSPDWETTEVVSTESMVHSALPSITVDQNNAPHIVWVDNTNPNLFGYDGDISYKKWDITSSNWLTTEILSSESWGNSWAPLIAVDSGNSIHIVWHDNSDFNSFGTHPEVSDFEIVYKMWDANTLVWSSIEVISSGNGNSWYPVIAVDHYDFVHVLWYDDTNYDGSGNDSDIFYKSNNGVLMTSSTTIDSTLAAPIDTNSTVTVNNTVTSIQTVTSILSMTLQPFLVVSVLISLVLIKKKQRIS